MATSKTFTTPLSKWQAPLTFDRVSDGLPVTSQTLLFRFPIELISAILEDLSSQDLAALALVDADCRQLARSVQFANVVFDISNPTEGWELLSALDSERVGKAHKSFMCTTRRLGPCVRRLKIFSKSMVSTSVPAITLPERLVSKLVDICTDALPNLYVLDWRLPYHLAPSEDLLVRLGTSPARHIRFNATWSPSLALPVAAQIQPKLETLIIDNSDGSISSVLGALHSSRSTLRTFVWRNYGPLISLPAGTLSLVLSSLPQLRQLHLEGFHIDDSSPYSLPLLPSRLSHLCVNGSDSSVYEYFQSLGSIGSLRSVCFSHSTNTNTDAMLDFLESNSHILSLDITLRPPNPNSRLPLQFHFNHLIALRLVFETSYTIPTDCLSALLHIPTLESIWLSAGPQDQNEFVVDHSALLPLTRALPRLTTLVLTRDTYPTESHPLLDPALSSPSRYYSAKRLPSDVFPEDFLTETEFADIRARILPLGFEHGRAEWRAVEGLAWERWHASKMRDLAGMYFGEAPGLRYVYVGKMPVYRDEGEGRGGHWGWACLDFNGRLVNERWQDVVSCL